MQFFKNILQNEELRMQLACIAVSGAALLASMLDILRCRLIWHGLPLFYAVCPLYGEP